MALEDTLIRLMKDARIEARVKELNLTPEQIEDALPILIDMEQEKDDDQTNWLTSFKLNLSGDVVRTQVRSSGSQKFAYLENIITHKIDPFVLDDKLELIKENGRANFMFALEKILEKSSGSRRGLFLYGKYGVGKTFLMKRLAKRFATEGKKVAFISTPTLSQEIKKTFGNNQSTPFSMKQIISMISEADYLFLDDIGAESISPWFRDDCLFPILNYRMQREMPTFFTSNFSQQALTKKEATTTNNRVKEHDKAQRLISRIAALAEEVEISGTNKRY